jgi:hypothetical protein
MAEEVPPLVNNHNLHIFKYPLCSHSYFHLLYSPLHTLCWHHIDLVSGTSCGASIAVSMTTMPFGTADDLEQP